VAGVRGAELVHSHTWYANLAGHWAKLAWGVPHVATTHSLEPLRPWKREQLGGGYELSCYAERTGLVGAEAVIAVSEGMRRDVLDCYPEIDPARVRVIHNGIDPELYRPLRSEETMRALGVDPGLRCAIFVGRVTRQKGLQHLLRAALLLPAGHQLVVCAGAPDTPEIAAEVGALAEQVRERHGGLVWIEGILPREQVIHLLTAATVFVCPSIYEPFGLVNLEAMACETAVVATATGGIVEVVDASVTGLLVPIEPGDDATGEPRDPAAFAAAFAEGLNAVVRDPARAAEMGRAGRARAVERFAWPAIAQETVALYERLL
jgi:alpha-maltose-1-phosphate synthase